MAIFDDLEAEQDRLEEILGGLDGAQWLAPSAAAGWTVADVVLHLAQSEEAVMASASGASLRAGPGSGATVDQIMDDLVRAEREEPSRIFRRWREARRGAVSALRMADPGQPMSWVEAPLKPATMATTRLAEHWAHGLDITGPLDIPFPDTDRLRHVAWLSHLRGIACRRGVKREGTRSWRASHSTRRRRSATGSALGLPAAGTG